MSHRSARRLEAAEVVIASHNAGKVGEIALLLAPLRVRGAASLGLAEPEETGETFVENAALKARAAAAASGLVAIADDSGLVVPALGGQPGVYSARWAGRDPSGSAATRFARAMERVHRELGDRDRRATMVCALALAWPDGHLETFEGRVDGTLVWPPRGELGFGYEPMFMPRGSTRTYGEMPRDEKHEDDPRARAFAQLRAACW